MCARCAVASCGGDGRDQQYVAPGWRHCHATDSRSRSQSGTDVRRATGCSSDPRPKPAEETPTMTEFGYALSSEEHSPKDLVANARAAEEAGFTFALISDHFHPWISRQGQSPFVWSILGAIAQTTDRLVLGTGVTCPTIRTHPAIIAQAAATTAALMPDRFFLGLGTGENLNEPVVGRGWPSLEVRTEMLEEAVEVIRELWKGQLTNHRGRHFTVENARLYTLPDRLPPVTRPKTPPINPSPPGARRSASQRVDRRPPNRPESSATVSSGRDRKRS